MRSDDPTLTLPHPLAHQRAFVLVSWLAADPAAQLRGVPVTELLAAIDAGERDGVAPHRTGAGALMGPTRKRDLAIGTVLATVVAYLLVILVYRWFPATVWTGLSLLVFAAVEAGWAFFLRAKIRDGAIGGRPHPSRCRAVGRGGQGIGLGRAGPRLVARRARLRAPRRGVRTQGWRRPISRVRRSLR